MYNWSTDTTAFKTQADREIWELEQLINYGLGDQKINRSKLESFWDKLEIDPARRKFLKILLDD